ncbi:MAG: hypothetical protein R3E42_07135 [Burkholderiaceae bacterium]
MDPSALLAGGGHGCEKKLHVFLRGAEGLLAVEQGDFAGQRLRCSRPFDVVELDAQVFDPLLVGFGVGQVGLEFLVVDHGPAWAAR